MVGKFGVHEGGTDGLGDVNGGRAHENARHEMARRRVHRVHRGLLRRMRGEKGIR